MLSKLFRFPNKLKSCLTIFYVCNTIEFTNYGFYLISVKNLSFFISNKLSLVQSRNNLLKNQYLQNKSSDL